MKSISKFILFKILGWEIENSFPTGLNKYVLIIAPHTHWVDFPIGILIKYATGLKANYIGKASLFKPPFGFIFKALGGTPVVRDKNNNVVDAVVDIFNKNDHFIFALSPEGTRKKVKKWKSGFYFIAKGAKVPIVSVALDFGDKKITISEPFYPTDDKDADFLKLRSFFKSAKGKVVENS